jgi:competence protein ComEC
MFVAPPEHLVPGDLFVVRASIGPVPSYGVPGAFDYHEYLASQGIHVSGWIRSPALIMEIHRLAALPWGERIRYLPEAIRYRLSRFLATSLPPHQVGVYQAILLSGLANLSPKVMEDFKASGSFHILSISGLHMALVSLCFTYIFSWLLKRSEWVLLHLPATKVAALLSLIPLTLYALIAGFNPPVVRSLVMVSVFVFALLVDRQWSLPNNIAIAAFLLLALNPALLFTASFQLTFVAVASIVLFAPILAKIIGQKATNEMSYALKVWLWLKKWALASLLVSLVASLGTAPILAYQFNRISLISPLSTLLIEPFLCLWSLMLGLAACLLVGFPSFAKLLLDLGGIGIDISLAIVDRCARIPWSSVWVPTPAMTSVIAWYGVMFLLVYGGKLSRRATVFLGMVCLMLVAIPFLPVRENRLESVVTVLDVGQGSAIVIELPNREVILIDGGRKQSPSVTGMDVGENLIAPFLWHKRITRLSMIVCTHPDDDHYNGIPFILAQFKPRILWVNGYDSDEKSYLQMLELANELHIETKVPTEGMILMQSEGAMLSALTGGQSRSIESTEGVDKKKGLSRNDQSLVLRFTHGQTSFLLPSDIEKETENALLGSLQHNLKTDVLVAAHHGSATSSSEGFLKAVAPRYVVISAGQNQAGHFPAPETMIRLKKLDSTILNTADQGSLFFKSDGKDIRVQSHRRI